MHKGTVEPTPSVATLLTTTTPDKITTRHTIIRQTPGIKCSSRRMNGCVAQAYLVLRARALLVRVRLQPHVLADVVLVRTAPENANRSSFLDHSLRVSRAHLGKQSFKIYKRGLKHFKSRLTRGHGRAGMSRGRLGRPRYCAALAARGRTPAPADRKSIPPPPCRRTEKKRRRCCLNLIPSLCSEPVLVGGKRPFSGQMRSSAKDAVDLISAPRHRLVEGIELLLHKVD